ncbi:50S ribosomal protein L14 [Candidatus Dojkabacteria bacterium]|jgi:large subunit ribosomal protein L14|uniref:Large ribosomal subunit protein uL14 n=1 Tax=Candidatus Dojkabacteria bacterium TaxID=2099670 RepID=A0A955IB47_9BACT|nr:50S ribosomal protein L14 [Candidatus Dojkabacteria bacterium]HRN86248.1 50S ribosomal protein L14 [Candidatus Dojkabacteria bacterium]HRO64614.1 50S ribosomal protein L14 [Candidatus Dojkabacteria bacterium]HRP36446.1 50S ribosomal protein L14 [Candidatus Dojkabacteria bacterium]HRP51425.1 50S ribosomal protein L14 [Candidatus Dojkabacteria bacterium]
MVQNLSRLTVTDNSGAKTIMVIRVMGRGKGNSFQRFASVGEMVKASVKKALPNSNYQQGDVVDAVVVRTTKEVKRKDGSYIRFDDNAAVIIDKAKKEPKATRIFGPVARELREKGYGKIVSLAQEVL